MDDQFDIGIIGGGCIGCAIAQRLCKYDLKIALIEKEADVAMGTTKANSGIIHQGYFTTKNSLKEHLSIRGNLLLDELCPKLKVNMKRIGSLFCATSENEIKTLKGEFSKCIERKIEVEFISEKGQLKEIEPSLKENVIAGLHFPKAGIILPWELTIALAELSILNGVQLFLNFEVGFIKKKDDYFILNSTSGQKIQIKTIINAAGLFSDKIAQMIGDHSFDIIPRKGEYIMFDKNSLSINKILFPCPTLLSKGIVVGKTMHNNFFVGPNAEEIDDIESNNTTIKGLNEILYGGQKLVDLPLKKHITNFAGIRASTNRHDFIIENSKISNLINVAGIDSPGLTCSLSIAEKVEEILRKKQLYISKIKKNYIDNLQKRDKFSELSEEELIKKIRENPKWGNIICRCELVSEAEIIDACHRPIPCTNVDMIKRRLRPGMGRCQGGFCQSKVMKIISREHGIILEEVTKTGKNSRIVIKRLKGLNSEIYQGEIN